MEPDNLGLDRFLLALSGKPKPKVCFIPTASGDSADYLARFYDAMKHLSAEPSHLSLFKGPVGDLREYVLDKDVFYVGGGNTRNMLALWREWGLDGFIREAYQQGKVMGGVSAGALCWFEEGVTDSIPGALTALKCLGMLPGSYCPHYDGEVERRPTFHRLMGQGMLAGLACDDGAAAHFVNETFVESVASRPQASTYRVWREGREVREEAVPTRRL